MTSYPTIETRLQAGDGSSPEQYTDVAGVVQISGPALKLNMIDVTALEDAWRRRMAGEFDGTQVAFDLVFDPDLATHAALMTDFLAKEPRAWRVIFPNFATGLAVTVNTTTEVWTTASAHGYLTGEPVRLSTTDTLPACTPAVAAGTTYFARVTDTDKFTLHPTSADAVAGTNTINATGTGTGTHTVSRATRWTFTGTLSAFTPKASVGQRLEASATIDIDNSVVPA